MQPQNAAGCTAIIFDARARPQAPLSWRTMADTLDAVTGPQCGI
jgi:hypothetical protein